MSNTVLVRTALTPAEWIAIRKLALDTGTPVGRLVADTLREHLLGGKPA